MVLARGADVAAAPAVRVDEHEPVLRSIASGLRFVRGKRALVGSFVIDLLAMTFGMPRALFPVLVAHRLPRGRGGHRRAVRGGGARGDGGRADHRLARARALPRPDSRRRRGRLGAGDRGRGRSARRCSWPRSCSPSPAPPTASAPSAAARSRRRSPPIHMRGRMSSVFMLVVNSGPRLGDVEAGAVASVATPALLGGVTAAWLRGRAGGDRDGVPAARGLRRGRRGSARRGTQRRLTPTLDM